MADMPEMIYDRTAADIEPVLEIQEKAAAEGWDALTPEEAAFLADSPKGSYCYTDVNRVETATRYLNTLLVSYGNGQALTTVIDWTEASNFSRADIDRIRNNVISLYSSFAEIPEWQQILITATFDFEQANALEWGLYQIDLWTQRMIAGMTRYCGTFYCGEDPLWFGASFVPTEDLQLLDAGGNELADADGNDLYVRG